MHPFEKAGLGKPPYRITGVEYKVGPIRQLDEHGNPTGLEIGAPGQPMGCCQYCYQGIKECWWIRSADGKDFYVGCDCVAKANKEHQPESYGELISKQKLDSDIRAMKTKLHKEANQKRVDAAMDLLMRTEKLWRHINTLPHSKEWAAKQGKTRLDEINWLWRNSGLAGKTRVARVIEQTAKEMGIL